MIRSPAYAGSFYPATAEDLNNQFQGFSTAPAKPSTAIGMMAPHAGYIYSGKTAFMTYQQVQITDTAVVLAPNHTGSGSSVAMYTKGMWRTPLGGAEIDEALAEKIMTNISGAKNDFMAHDREHSLEVQIPFLQFFNKDILIVPLQLKHLGLEKCRELGQQLATVIAEQNPRPLLVASSDMSHYESAQAAKAKDKRAIEQILKLDPEKLYKTVTEGNISMCGVVPTTVMLFAAKELGAKQAELVRYSNSGDVNGDYEQVVGYAGIVIR